MRTRGDTEDERSYLDLVGVTTDPIEAIYLGLDDGRIPVMTIPMRSLRVESLGLRLDDLETNPYTRTVAAYLSGEHVEYAGSELERHLEKWRPQSLAQFLGLPPGEKDPYLLAPMQVEILPWERPASPEELVARREANERTWALKFGPGAPGHGSTTYGPASDQLGRYRFAKHCDLAASIASHASRADRDDPRWWDPDRGGFVEVQLMIDDGEAVAVVREGKHRSAALAALGTKEMIVAIPPTYPLIHRSEVASWPYVRSGIFTIEQALCVFDRFFAGVAPWIEAGATKAL